VLQSRWQDGVDHAYDVVLADEQTLGRGALVGDRGKTSASVAMSRSVETMPRSTARDSRRSNKPA
jgi:hypothetical protein